MTAKTYQSVLSALLLLPIAAIGETGYQACGSLDNGYGPFDYRSTDRAKIEVVEKFHFTPKVETLKGGSTASTPGGDLAYTLSRLLKYRPANADGGMERSRFS